MEPAPVRKRIVPIPMDVDVVRTQPGQGTGAGPSRVQAPTVGAAAPEERPDRRLHIRLGPGSTVVVDWKQVRHCLWRPGLLTHIALHAAPIVHGTMRACKPTRPPPAQMLRQRGVAKKRPVQPEPDAGTGGALAGGPPLPLRPGLVSVAPPSPDGQRMHDVLAAHAGT